MEVTIKHLKELGYKAYAYYVNLDFEEELHGRYADSVFSDFKKAISCENYNRYKDYIHGTLELMFEDWLWGQHIMYSIRRHATEYELDNCEI